VKAFNKAVRATRWSLGRWGWWSWGGSEDQVLSDIISDEIDWQVMGKVYSKITGPWMVRSSIRNQVLKLIDGLVSGAVAPAWKAMSTSVEELRPKIEPKIKEAVGPIATAKKQVVDKITDAALGVVNPLLEKHVTPHLSKLIEIITAPVADSYTESFGIFEEAVKKYAENADLKNLSKGFGDLDWTGRSWWTMRPVTQKLDVMYDPLWLLREVFSEISPWSLIWNGHDQLRKRMDNAVYTFEERLKKKVEENPDAGKEVIEEVKNSVLDDYKSDGEVHRIEFYKEIIRAIVMPPLNVVLIPASKSVLEPIQSVIPDAVQQFIDIGEEFDNVVNGIVDGSIVTVIKS